MNKVFASVTLLVLAVTNTWANLKGDQFVRQYVGTPKSTYVMGATVDPALNVYVAAKNTTYPTESAFITKVSPLGTVLWTADAGANAYTDLALDNLGNLYATNDATNFGIKKRTVDAGSLWNATAGRVGQAYKVLVLPSGNICAAGYAKDPVLNTYLVTVACWSAAGALLWVNATDPYDYALKSFALSPDKQGGLYVSGSVASQNNLKLVTRRIDGNGATLWSRLYGSNLSFNIDATLHQYVAADGSMLLTTAGYEQAQGFRMLACRYAENGDLVTSVSDSSGRFCQGGVVSPSGDIFLVGRAQAAPHTLVARYAADGSQVAIYSGTPFQSAQSVGRRIGITDGGQLIVGCDMLNASSVLVDQGLAWFDSGCALLTTAEMHSTPYDPSGNFESRALLKSSNGSFTYLTSAGTFGTTARSVAVYSTGALGNVTLLATQATPVQSLTVKDPVLSVDDSVYISAGAGLGSNGSAESHVIKVSKGGSVLWVKSLTSPQFGVSVTKCVATSDGGIAVASSHSSNGSGVVYVEVMRLNSSGESLWTATISQVSRSLIAMDLSLCTDGGFAVCGSASNSNSPFFSKVSSTGQVEWTTIVPTATIGLAENCASDAVGNVYGVGPIDVQGSSYHSTVIYALSSTGAFLWSRNLYTDKSRPLSIKGAQILARANGHILVGDLFQVSQDGFLVVSEYANDGSLVWSDTTTNGRGFGVMSLAESSNGNICIGTGNDCSYYTGVGAKVWSVHYGGPAGFDSMGHICIASSRVGNGIISDLRYVVCNSNGGELTNRYLTTFPAVHLSPVGICFGKDNTTRIASEVTTIPYGYEVGYSRIGLPLANSSQPN